MIYNIISIDFLNVKCNFKAENFGHKFNQNQMFAHYTNQTIRILDLIFVSALT